MRRYNSCCRIWLFQSLLMGAIVAGLAASIFSDAHGQALPSPPRNYQPSATAWNLFISGDLELRCARPGLASCAPSINHTATIRRLRSSNDYQGAINIIIYQMEHRAGLEPADYFYYILGWAAENMNYLEAANSYYQKGIRARVSCLNYGPANNGHTCGGAFNFRSDWLAGSARRLEQRLNQIRQEADAERRRIAEAAQRERDAASAAAAEDARIERQAEIARLEIERREREEAEAAQRAAARLERELREREARITHLNSMFPSEWVELIMERRVQIGFSRQAVIESLGRPQNIVETPGGRSLWTYASQTIIFEGDSVRHISSK